MKALRGIGIGALGLGLASSAAAAMVGPASDYNVFIFGQGTFMSSATDTMGNLAAGGNVSLTSYTVAMGIAGNTAANPNPARLVVGGALTTQNGGRVGANGQGTIYYGTTPPSLNNSGTFTAGAQVANQSLVNFTAAQSFYDSYSQQLGQLGANGTTALSGSKLTMTGTVQGLNVFTLDGSLLQNAREIDISAPTNATVLINVTGNSATFTNGSVKLLGGLTGTNGATVLYNFVSATSVTLSANNSGFDPMGSILAPDAGVTGGFGAMDGQLLAGSYLGNTQFNNVVFAGSLPNPVPLPAAVWLFGSGLLGLFGMRRRAA